MDMVERVALEMARRRIGVKPEAWTPNPLLLTEWDWNTARAAIEAMRTPTEAMEDAGYTRDAFRAGTQPGSLDYRPDYIWQAMIDAALNTHPGEPG